MEFITKPSYYAKPDGEDYSGKMIASNRLILMGALPFATVDMLMYSKPEGYLASAACYAKWVGPAVGMASAFTTGCYAAQHLRGKDDIINYIVGACAAAGVFGKAIRSPTVGLQCCVFFSLAAAIKKVSVRDGWTFFPSEEEWALKRQYGTLRTAKYDFTIMKDTKEKGWTTGKE